jgi:hypothetical protein
VSPSERRHEQLQDPVRRRSHFLGVMELNVTAGFLCAQEAFGIMKSQEPKGGR